MLIHIFDGHLSWGEPWHVNADKWKAQLSCSMVNALKAGRFSNEGGVVLSPATRTRCSYPYDGGAMGKDDGCGTNYCSANHRSGCAFPPSMLKDMMTLHQTSQQWPYNEVVVDPSHMVIEAVFNCKWCSSSKAADMHAKLLQHHGLNANQLPLLPGHWMEDAAGVAGAG